MQTLQFQCKIDQNNSILKLSPNKLVLSSQTCYFSFALSLDLIVGWIVHGHRLVGFTIDSLIIMADLHNLEKLKKQLGGQVTYSGIIYFYTFLETLNFNKNGETKICSLVLNSTNEKFVCKCFKRKDRGLDVIHNEIQLLLSLQTKSFVPKIYEVYESRNCIYLIMEYIQQELHYEIDEDKMKLVIYNLFQIVQSFEELNICHQTICRSHVMLDDNLNVILVGFRNAKTSKVSHYEFELDIYKCASILYKYYQKQNLKKFDEVPLLQDILSKQYLYLFNISLILQDPYFKPIRCEGIVQEIKSMTPKFKKNIEDNLIYNLNASIIQLNVNYSQGISNS